MRHVINRIGIVLGDGGALNQMLLPFKLGLGGILGTGKVRDMPAVELVDPPTPPRDFHTHASRPRPPPPARPRSNRFLGLPWKMWLA